MLYKDRMKWVQSLPAHKTHWRCPLSTWGAGHGLWLVHWYLQAWYTLGTPKVCHSHWSNQFPGCWHHSPETKMDGSCSNWLITHRYYSIKFQRTTIQMLKAIFCQKLKDQWIETDRVWSYNSAICYDIFISDLSIELSQEVKVLLEVCGQDSLNDKEAKTLELHVIQIDQKVELWLGQVEAPGRCSMVVLQHWPVIVQHGLRNTRGKTQVVREGKDSTQRRFYNFLYNVIYGLS